MTPITMSHVSRMLMFLPIAAALLACGAVNPPPASHGDSTVVEDDPVSLVVVDDERNANGNIHFVFDVEEVMGEQVASLAPKAAPSKFTVITADDLAVAAPEEEHESSQGDRPVRLKVRSLFMARDVQNKMPRAIDHQFNRHDFKLWAWTRVENRDRPSSITMVWRHEGQQRKRVELDVGVSDGWRTWTSHQVGDGDEGQWTVEVRDEAGELLETTRFRIDGREASVGSADVVKEKAVSITYVRR